MPSPTYEGFALLRSILKSGSEADVAKAVDYAQADQALSAVAGGQSAGDQFVDVIDMVFDATIPYDLRFFESLDRMVQIEPWLSATRR